MPSVTSKVVSFRSQLKETLSSFLGNEKMECPATEEGLLDLVVALSDYTEEGQSLFPQVLLCDDLTTTLAVLQCSDSLTIGKGQLSKTTMLEALKRCAPLAHHGWVVYLWRLGDEMEYGLLRTPYSPTAPAIRDTIQALVGQANSPRAILVAQLANKAVELSGTGSGSLTVYLSATPDDAPPPQASLGHLVGAVCAEVPGEERERVQSFVSSVLSTGIRQCHGTLVAVLPAGGRPEDVTSDGVIFTSPIPLGEKVEEHERRRSDDSLAALDAYGYLLMGMLNSDGAIIMDSRCRLRGYNLFVKDELGSGSPKTLAEGGARHRAYMILKQLVDNATLNACYICSRDGGSDFYER